MFSVPIPVFSRYLVILKKNGVALPKYDDYKKWLRYYLDFCDKYEVAGSKSERFRFFMKKLREKNQTEEQRHQAAHAISLYFEMQRKDGKEGEQEPTICEVNGHHGAAS